MEIGFHNSYLVLQRVFRYQIRDTLPVTETHSPSASELDQSPAEATGPARREGRHQASFVAGFGLRQAQRFVVAFRRSEVGRLKSAEVDKNLLQGDAGIDHP